MKLTPNPVTSTLCVAANATSASIALPAGGGLVMSLMNRGPQDVAVEFFPAANMPATMPVAGTNGSFLVAANMPARDVFLRTTDTHMSYVSAGNSTLYGSRCALLG